MEYVCNKEKGHIRIGNKKYFKGDPIPKGFEVPKLWIDRDIVVPKGTARAEVPKEPEVKKDKKKVDGGKS